MKKLTMLVAAAFAMTSAMAQLNPMEPIRRTRMSGRVNSKTE